MLQVLCRAGEDRGESVFAGIKVDSGAGSVNGENEVESRVREMQAGLFVAVRTEAWTYDGMLEVLLAHESYNCLQHGGSFLYHGRSSL